MIFIFFYRILAYVCQYESQFNSISKIETIEKESSSNYLFPTVKYYAVCLMKNSDKEAKLEMCSDCYKRASFDNMFFTVAKKCNRVNIDKFHHIFSLKDTDTNYILVIECKYKFVLPVYFNGSLFAVDFQILEKINSKYLLNQHSLEKLVPYKELKDIVGYQYLKAENCIISLPLDEYVEREYSKDLISKYTEAFNNLYTCDIAAICGESESDTSSEEKEPNNISKIYQNMINMGTDTTDSF